MQHHYSTVGGQEIREGIAKVISLAKAKEALTSGQEGKAGRRESGVLGGVPGPEMKKAG